MGLLLIGILGLSILSVSIFKQQNLVMAQQYVQTIKYRNLIIDLGNGVMTNTQLTYPAVVVCSLIPFRESLDSWFCTIFEFQL
jgi:hypothetical protein